MLLLTATISACVLAADTPAGSKVTAQVVQDQAASSAGVLMLEEAVRTALARNPGVQSAAHEVAAERAKAKQAGALPDPTFGIGWMGNIQPFSVQTGDPSSYRSVSAMQMVPFPGKRSLRGTDRFQGSRCRRMGRGSGAPPRDRGREGLLLRLLVLRQGDPDHAGESRAADEAVADRRGALSGGQRDAARMCCARRWRFPCCCRS